MGLVDPLSVMSTVPQVFEYLCLYYCGLVISLSTDLFVDYQLKTDVIEIPNLYVHLVGTLLIFSLEYKLLAMPLMRAH